MILLNLVVHLLAVSAAAMVDVLVLVDAPVAIAVAIVLVGFIHILHCTF